MQQTMKAFESLEVAKGREGAMLLQKFCAPTCTQILNMYSMGGKGPSRPGCFRPLSSSTAQKAIDSEGAEGTTGVDPLLEIHQ